ncbi:MAG: methyl-accepting chemotaxis protein [Psychrobium sp.]
MSFFSNMRISQRLGLSFIAILLLLVLIATMALTQMNKQSAMAKAFVTDDVVKFVDISAIKSHAQRSALLLLQILPTEERSDRINLYKDMDEENRKLDSAIKKVSESFNETTPIQFTTLLARQKSYNENFIETVEYVEFDSETALSHYQESTKPALEALLMSISDYLESERMRMFKHQETNAAASDDIQNMVVVISVIALLLGIALAIGVSRSIVAPLNSTVKLARKIAQGNLQQVSIEQRGDEVGDLVGAIEEMRANLAQLISSIVHSSKDIEDSATALNMPVQEVHEGSVSQVAAVEDIGRAIYEFSVQSNQSAQTAQQAKSQSLNARDLASQGKDMIEQATREFATISTTISDSADAVQGVHHRAKAVRDLITMISEIADQTNLLALNAAIEAARAGESGRGFSVVADEVRALAGRTAQATTEINQVIDGIDNETNNAVDRITAGQAELEKGVDMLQQMVTPLVDLNAGAQESLTSLEQLEQAVAEQATESAHIEDSVKNIGDKANSNQAEIDKVTSTTNHLSDMALGLSRQVSKFRLH